MNREATALRLDRWPAEFIELAEQFGEHLANTADGSAYFHMDRPHANVWYQPKMRIIRIQFSDGERSTRSWKEARIILGIRRKEHQATEKSRWQRLLGTVHLEAQ